MHPNTCPACNSGNADSLSHEPDGIDRFIEEMICNDCESEWNNIYTFQGQHVTHRNRPNFNVW